MPGKDAFLRNLTLGVAVAALGLPVLQARADMVPSTLPVTLVDAQQGGDANTQGARAFVDKMASQAVAFLGDRSLSQDQKRDQFRSLLLHDFDMDTIGRFALGTYWNQTSPAQRQDYQSLFREMIVRVYSSRFQNYNGQSFKTTGVHPDNGTDTIVNSLIIPADNDGPQVQVDWRIRFKNGQYRVVDVIIEGVSMAVTQRSDFSSVIQQSGGNVDALLARLRGQASGATPVQAQ